MKNLQPINSKRVLLADCGFSSIPLLISLKKNGYYVGICGSKKNDPCHQLADKSHLIDYSKITALESVCINYRYDYLIAGCTDISYISCATIAEKLNIPGYDSLTTAKKIFNKDSFRKLCHSLNISSPRFVLDPLLVNQLQFPILKKPTDSFSGIGIEKFDYEKNFIESVKKNLTDEKGKDFVYEEFVEGVLYSHSAFLNNGKITNDFFVREYSTINSYQVNSSHLDNDLTVAIKNKIRKSIQKIAKTLNLVNGLVHTQFISNNLEFWLIEMTRRCPGDLYSQLIQLSTNINYPELYINSYLNKKNTKKFYDETRYFSRHTLSAVTPKIYSGMTCNVSSLKTILFNLKNLGEIVKAAPFDRAAVIFIEHETSVAMKRETPNLYKKISFNE